MAYFDSPKNRALWEVELKKLREEKKLREMGRKSGAAVNTDPATARREKNTDTPHRIRTSYKELLEESRREHEAKHGGRRQRTLDHSRERSKSMNDLTRKPMVPGKVKA